MKKGQITKKVQARRDTAKRLTEILREKLITEKVFKKNKTMKKDLRFYCKHCWHGYWLLDFENNPNKIKALLKTKCPDCKNKSWVLFKYGNFERHIKQYNKYLKTIEKK